MSQARGRCCVGGAVLLLRAGARPRPERRRERIVVPEPPPGLRRRAGGDLALPLASAVCALGLRRLLTVLHRLPADTQLLGARAGSGLRSFSLAGLIVIGEAAGRQRGARGGLTPSRRTRAEQERIVQVVEGERPGLHPSAACWLLGARRRRAGRSGSRCSRRPPRSGPVPPRALLPDAVAARNAAGGRAGRAVRAAEIEEKTSTRPSPRARKGGAGLLVVVVRPPGELGAAPRERAATTSRDRRLLEDLHPRRLRDRALPRAAVRADRPQPALVCPCHYSTFDPATGGTVTSARRAASCRCCRSDRPQGLLRARGNFDGPVGRRGGASGRRSRRRDPRDRPLPRPAHGRGAVPAQDAALPLPRPLVVPAGRGRALLRSSCSSAPGST